ncbi:MAG: M28 family peptidase [Niabella sp.]
MKNIILLGSLFIGLTTVAQKKEPIIKVDETTKIINHLASDEMKGRKTFSPEIDKAAFFIDDYFRKAGLRALNNAPSYLQTFYMASAKQTNLSGQINGTLLTGNNTIVITTQKELRVTANSGYNIVKILSGDRLFPTAASYVKNGKNTIVLVDSSFAGNFERLRYFQQNIIKSDVSTIFILGTPDMRDFSIVASHQIEEKKLSNVVGLLPGKSKPDEFVIFSAHYDHIGIGQPENEDSIYNGANDDASGTTAVMLLAKYFGQLKNNERSILFVAFTAEEIGLIGSAYFSQQLPPEKVVAMVNIEMIGTDSKWGKNSAYITGYEQSDLGAILNQNLKGSRFTFHPDPYPLQQLFYRSDNATLARMGVPAHTVSTSKMDNEPHYHKASDEVNTLDLKNMTAIIEAIGMSAGSIISGKDTPTRVENQ